MKPIQLIKLIQLNPLSLFYLIFFVVFLLSIIAGHGADAKGTEVSFKKCLECHPDVQKQMAQQVAHAPFSEHQCSACHNPHASNHKHLIKDEINVLCINCHQSEKTLMPKQHNHKPFKEGECLSCHKPHASKNKNLLIAAGEQLCFGCHSDEKDFSKKNKHDPVRKGKCLSCHTPHSSDNEMLLKKSSVQICTGCHLMNNRVNNKKTEKAHRNYPVQNTKCVSCHNPHGSNHDGLIKENSHKPFAKKQCAKCHYAAKSKNSLKIKSDGVSICTACHKSIEQDFRKINTHVRHGIFCIDCHNPHASDEDHLKKNKETKICNKCHADTFISMSNKKNKHKHPSVIKGECTNCHRPHGSNFRFFFKTDELDLCASCHKKHATFTHPIGEKAIDPRSKRSITCITCHNLMGSSYDFALRFDRKKELCLQCHKGY